jgi:protein-disulfide isomerase
MMNVARPFLAVPFGFGFRKGDISAMNRALLVLVLLFATATAAQNPPASSAGPSAAELQKRTEAFVRNIFAWGPEYQVKVGVLKPASLPGFYQVTIEVSVGSASDTALMYISKDGRHLIRGDVLDTNEDPFAENRRKISLEGRPSLGPAAARVVVVDFSDFQCPHCRQLDQLLRELQPRYPQVRFVSKHFPLSQIHPWAETAHLAAECTQRLNPAAYRKVHHAIFDRQDKITTESVWQTMLEVTGQAGVDPVDFKACMVAPETKAAVQKDVAEGQAVKIANTPTVFVNGRRVVGGDPQILRQYIDYELSAGAKP